MKKQLLILSLLLFLFLTGCYLPKPFHFSELQNTPSSKLDPLELTPSYDLYNFRFDIVRQTEEDCSDEGVEYHSLGFRLGNGLFYDMNGNLSFNAHELFGLTNFQNFKISADPVLASYSKTDEGIETTAKLFWKKVKFMEKIEVTPEGNVLLLGNRKHPETTTYGIYQNDNELKLGNPNSKCVIKTTDSGYSFFRNQFYKRGNEIFLGSDFMIKEHSDKIEIFSYHKKPARQNLLYTIQKIGNDFIVYDRNYYGARLNRSEQGVLKYEHNKRLFIAYRLLEKEK